MGRPTLYSAELAAKIMVRLAGGLSVNRLCKHEDMPDKSTFYRWLTEHEDFRDNYARACEARGIGYGEKCAEIGEQLLAGEIDPATAKAAFDIYRWSAQTTAPRHYGNRLNLHHSGKITQSVESMRDGLESELARHDGTAGEEDVPRVLN